MITGAAFAASGLRATPLGRAHVATRLGALVLGLVTVMRLPAAGLVPAAGAVALGLTWTGMTFRHQAAALRPWAPVGVLMLLLHVFTTVAAAPLWHPSWAGLVAGILALVRVAASVGLLGLYLRVTSLDDLVAGAAWWLAPLRRLGVAVDDFGLVLAVALGTAPAVLGEGRRIAMVVRLRRHGPAAGPRPGAWRRALTRLRDRAHLVVPLVETLARRAEALSLSLRQRRPATVSAGALPWTEGGVLAAWTMLLVWSLW